MLDDCVTEETHEIVLRLASTFPEPPPATLLRRGISPDNIAGIVSVLSDVHMPLAAEEIVGHAFFKRDDKTPPFPVSRFSDGSIGIYYSALEETTCQRELEYHLGSTLTEAQNNAFLYPRFYSLIACSYSGITANLCGQENIHPELVSETKEGYPFCQQLGLQAIARDIDGFMTPSARNGGGTCIPVFKQSALSEPTVKYQVKLTTSLTEIKFQQLSK